MKEGRLIALGTTDELVASMNGKVWSCTFPAADLAAYEKKLRIVNLRNENDGRIAIRYLAQQAETGDSQMVQPRLEDLYLWLFPQCALEKEEED